MESSLEVENVPTHDALFAGPIKKDLCHTRSELLISIGTYGYATGHMPNERHGRSDVGRDDPKSEHGLTLAQVLPFLRTIQTETIGVLWLPRLLGVIGPTPCLKGLKN